MTVEVAFVDLARDDYDLIANSVRRGGWWGSVSCIEGELLDIELESDGVQPSCQVSDVVRNERDEVVHDRPLPACDGNNRPCWRIETDAVNCSWGHSNLAFEVDRIDPPPEDTHTVVHCETHN